MLISSALDRLCSMENVTCAQMVAPESAVSAVGAGGTGGGATRAAAQMSSSSRRCASVAARIASALRPCSASISALTCTRAPEFCKLPAWIYTF